MKPLGTARYQEVFYFIFFYFIDNLALVAEKRYNTFIINQPKRNEAMNETTLLKLLFCGSLVVNAWFAIRNCELEDTIEELTRHLKKSHYMKKEETRE